ncbi:MAG TPA: hypothetical protein VNO51_09955, partial [Ilumatobacteraceae bacterium]|nr:hypothetical protein [Ilumatobacteraceae bacterium]
MKHSSGARSPRHRRIAAIAVVTAVAGFLIAAPHGQAAAAGSDDVLFVPTLGRGGIPVSGVSAVVATVTAVDPSAAGFLTVFECAAGLPDTSNLNISANAVPNTAVIPIASDGMICVYRSMPMQVIVDVTGWISTDADAHPVRPVRSLDTRSGVGTRQAPIGPGERVRLQVVGGTIPQQASGVIANITATAAVDAGFLTVFPCDVGDQGTSNVNFRAGVDVANLAVLSLDADGAVCVESSAPTHVIIDVSAWIERSDAISVVPPTRLVDTRHGTRVGTDAPLVVGVATDGNVSTMLNVTSTRQSAAGFLTVYPCDAAVPTTSSVNFVPGADSAAAVLAKPSSDGHVCIQSSAETDVVVDLQATAAGGSGIRSLTPVRLVDTRSPANLASSASSTRRTIGQADIHNGVTLNDVLGKDTSFGVLSSIRQGSITVNLSWRGAGSATETVMHARHGATTLWEHVVVPTGRPESQLIIRASDPTTVYAVELIGTCDVGCSWYTTQGRLHAYDLSSGALRWVVPLGTTDDYRRVTVGDGLVLVGDGATVRAIDAATGADRWNRAAAVGTNQFGLGAVGQHVTVSEAQMTTDGRV